MNGSIPFLQVYISRETKFKKSEYQLLPLSKSSISYQYNMPNSTFIYNIIFFHFKETFGTMAVRYLYFDKVQNI